jgi:hypothetical protein
VRVVRRSDRLVKHTHSRNPRRPLVKVAENLRQDRICLRRCGEEIVCRSGDPEAKGLSSGPMTIWSPRFCQAPGFVSPADFNAQLGEPCLVLDELGDVRIDPGGAGTAVTNQVNCEGGDDG